MFRLCVQVCISPYNNTKNKGKRKQAKGKTTGDYLYIILFLLKNIQIYDYRNYIHTHILAPPFPLIPWPRGPRIVFFYSSKCQRVRSIVGGLRIQSWTGFPWKVCGQIHPLLGGPGMATKTWLTLAHKKTCSLRYTKITSHCQSLYIKNGPLSVCIEKNLGSTCFCCQGKLKSIHFGRFFQPIEVGISLREGHVIYQQMLAPGLGKQKSACKRG